MVTQEEWYSQSVALQQYDYYYERNRKTFQIPNYKTSFKITLEDNMLICNWGKLDPSIKIKDVVIEETINMDKHVVIEYLFIISEMNNPIMIATNKVCDTHNTIDPQTNPKCLYDNYYIDAYEGMTDVFCYYGIINKNQMENILNILNQKVAHPYGHFHHSNELLIYQKIFQTMLNYGMNKKLNLYLEKRKLVSTDMFNFCFKHKLKIHANYRHINNIVLYDIIEYYDGNYIDEDANIVDIDINETDFYPTEKSKLYVKCEMKNHEIKEFLLCKKVRNYLYCDKFDNDLESVFRYFGNRYARSLCPRYYNIYAFYILPSNEEQIKKIEEFILKKDILCSYNDIIQLLLFSCKEGFSTLEPNPTKKEDIPKDLEKIKTIVAQQEENQRIHQIRQIEKQLVFHLQQIEILMNSMKELQTMDFTIPKIRISEEYLIIKVDDHEEINPIFSSYLQFIDLGGISFSNVKVSGLDFSNTNAHIEPQQVYQKDMSNGNYQGVNFLFKSFKDVNIIGSTFDNGYMEFQYGTEFLGAIEDEIAKTKVKNL